MPKEKEASRKRYRAFIKEKGLFGDKDGPEDEKKDAPPADKGKPDAAASDDKPQDKPKKPIKTTLLRYFAELKMRRSRIVFILVMILVNTLLQAVMPWSGKFIIDNILSLRDLSVLVAFCAVLLCIGVSNVALNFMQDYIINTFLGTIVTNIKRKMMQHLQVMPLEKVQELKVGGIISRLQNDAERMSALLQMGLFSPFRAILMLTVGLGSLFFLNWRLTLVCLVFAAVVVVAAYFIFNTMRRFHKKLREEVSALTARLSETFSGIQVVRAFRRERSESFNFVVDNQFIYRKYLHGNSISMVVHRVIWVIYWCMLVAVYLYGGYHVITNRMSIGGLVVFISFIDWLFQPIFMIMSSFAEMQVSLACVEHVFELLDEPLTITDAANAKSVRTIAKAIVFEKVEFAYPNGTKAITDLDLTIPRGRITALVGPSGAGKSTITNLVMRFYDVTGGRILIDGEDIRNCTLGAYRGLSSLVLQDTFLFDGTVIDNIAYGKPDATLAEVIAAAKTAHCHEFVDTLEKKYETVIGERGVKLSGGQRQRLALARAILTDPELLILDEATSNLDSESEELIQDAMKKIFAGRTIIVIAHRLSTIMDADNIVVLEKGKKVEEGTHRGLLKRKGRYHKLYMTQMKKSVPTVLRWEDTDKKAEPKEA